MKNSKIPIPEKIDEIKNDDGYFCIRRKWFTLTVIPLIIFAIAWDSFLFFWYSMALNSKGDISWIMVIFPIGHVAVGIGITYFAIATLVNKTDIIFKHSELCIKTSPMKWRGDKEIHKKDIIELRIREKYRNQQPSFSLHYISKDNREKKLITGIKEYEQIEYLKLKIEDVLGIDNSTNLPT